MFIFINPSTVVRSAAILYIFDKAFQPYLCAIFFFVSFLSTSALDIDLFWHCSFFRVSLMFYAHFKTYLSQCDSFWLLDCYCNGNNVTKINKSIRMAVLYGIVIVYCHKNVCVDDYWVGHLIPGLCFAYTKSSRHFPTSTTSTR